MIKRFNNWTSFYNRIMLVFNGIIAFSLLPFAWVFLEMERGDGGLVIMEGIRKYVFELVLSVAIASILFYAHRQFRKSLDDMVQGQPLGQKLYAYYEIQVRKLVFFEAAAILALLACYLNSDYVFVAIYVFILFLFSLGRPKYDKVVEELKLTKAEQQLLESGADLE